MSSVLQAAKITFRAADIRSELYDQLKRPLHDLRISVIDRCNLRCSYCMPETETLKRHSFINADKRLSFAEIERLVRVFAKLGVAKVRLTGGEPLLRRDLPSLIARLNNIPGIEDIGLTTNGILLERHAAALSQAGLHRVTVSLDALDKTRLAIISGGRADKEKILAGIDAALKHNLAPVKVNTVVIRGVNDTEVLPLVEHFRNTGVILRFIEYMDTGTISQWQRSSVVSSKELLQLIHQRWPLRAQTQNYQGEVASRYIFEDGAGEIGFISSVTQPFCEACTRARITSDGKLYTCLFGKSGFDLRALLSAGASDEEITNSICGVWSKREDRYSELRNGTQNQTIEHAEMFYLGG
ncbi:MAG: GTP 3',8-cyclase MoaA [Gammaproteobacteria bacterium]